MAVNTRDLLQFLQAHHSTAIEAHLDTTLAALADQWQPARAQIASRIGWLQDLMQQAQDAGVEIDPTWLAQEQRLTTLLREIDDATQSFADAAQSTIGDAQLDAIDLAQQAAQEYMQAALPDGVAATFGVPPQGALDAMASALEEDSPLSALFDAFGADASASASQALFSAVALGQSAAQIADLLERTTDMSAQRAEVIARTELLRSYRDAQMANYRANADVVTAWMWSASFSERTCGACLAMDSTIHPLEDSLDDHICGRCIALPVTTPYKDILGQLGIDASANPALVLDTTGFAGLLGSGRQTGSEWLAAQDYATQVRILGPAKAAAIYKYGDIKLQDLVGINKSAVWGDSIREHSLRELGLNARDYLTEFKLPPRELVGAGEAAATAEAERVAQTVEEAARAVDAFQIGASVDEARALAAADAAAGGRGAIILTDNPERLDAMTERMFGRALSRDELGGLVGAPEGAYVDIYVPSDRDALEIGLRSPEWNPDRSIPDNKLQYWADRVLESRGRSGLVMTNDDLFVSKDLAGQHVGRDIFTDQVETLSDLGVARIETFAAGDYASIADANGYYTWPRFGFTGALPDSVEQSLHDASAAGEVPAAWGRYTTVQQLMRSPEGREWWKVNGRGVDLRFDLKPGSYSMKTFQSYLEEVGARTATAAEGVTHTFDWEAEHVAELSRSLGVEPPPALFGRQVEQGNAAWEDWYHTHLAPLLPDGYVDPVFGPADAGATNAAETAVTETASEAQQALEAAQARVDDLRQQFMDLTSGENAVSVYQAARDINADEALWDLAKAQAAVDVENGGRGAIIFARDYTDPFGAMASLNETTESIFGHTLSTDELGGLVGAPEGAHVVISGDASRGLSIYLHGPSYDPLGSGWQTTEYEAQRFLLPAGRGGWYMDNTNFHIREDLAGQGLGGQIFSDEVQTLSDLHVRFIETNAAGSGNYGDPTEPVTANGYYTWPRFGYLGHLPAYSRDMIQDAIANGEVPAAWGRYTTIQQLMRTPEGRTWWKTYGTELDGLRFDLKPDSLSMRLLNDYLDEKGIAARASSAGLDDLAPLLPKGYVDPVFGPASADDVPFSEARALSQYMNTVQASYDLTAEDQTFAAQIREQIGQLDQNALAHTDALEIGGQLHDRITGDAEMARYQGYAQEFAEMRAKGPEFFTPDEAAWAKNDPDAIAAHGGVKFLDAVARVQAEYQARVAAYLSAVRDMGGELDVVARTGSTVADRVFDDITAAQTNLPSDWIAASNDLGQLRINSVGRASNYGGYYQGFYNGNGAIALYTDMVRDVEVQSTFTHEFMHRMEDVLPQLGRLETEFYNARTAGDALVDLTNGIQMQTKLDQWVDEYLGRVPFATSQGGQSYELLSIGAEAALGGGAGFDMAALREDREFMSFVLGLLTIVRADGAAAGAEAAAAVTAIDEATAALDAINAADQGAQRAFSVASEGRDEASIVTYVSDAARERLARPFGGQALSDDEVARLAGAPPGSSVTVSRIGEITVTPPDGRYTSSVIVQQGDAGAPALLNWRFEAPDGSNGIPVDPEALAMQVRQANALGVESIHMKSRAASNDYALLPQLGYNASIGVALTESRSASLPADLRDARTLLDLLATPEGRAWWGENGLNPGLDFDPRPGSRSWLTLNAYLHDHGFKGLDE